MLTGGLETNFEMSGDLEHLKASEIVHKGKLTQKLHYGAIDKSISSTGLF